DGLRCAPQPQHRVSTGRLAVAGGWRRTRHRRKPRVYPQSPGTSEMNRLGILGVVIPLRDCGLGDKSHSAGTGGNRSPELSSSSGSAMVVGGAVVLAVNARSALR